MAAGLLAACAPAVGALAPATLTEPTLATRAVRVVSLESGTLRFVDGDRHFLELPTRDVVRLRFDRAAPDGVAGPDAEASPRWLRLTDGQVFRGQIDGAEDGGEALRWRHPRLGHFVVALNHIAALGVAEVPPPNADTAGAGDDRVTLLNGDALRGFVVAVEPDGLVLDRGDAGEVTLPWSNVSTVELANPVEAPSGSADVVALADGSVVRSEPVSFDEAELELAPLLSASPTPALRLPLDAISAIDFGASGLRLLGLSAVPLRVIEGGEAFGLLYEPFHGDGVIRLHAPVRIALEFPGQARRFSAEVGLDLPPRTPPAARRLAAVTLWVHDGDAPPTRLALDADHPTRRVNLPLVSGGLELRLDASAAGPVLGRVGLRDARVLLAVPAEPLSGVDAEP